MGIYTDDDVKIKSKTITKKIIPRLKKSEIDLDFTFEPDDFDSLADFQSLNHTDELEIKLDVVFTYAYVYTIEFEISMDTELD